MGHAASTLEQVVKFATPADYAICRELHRKFGTTYYFASRRFRPLIRDRVDALYGFVRVPDEWVDNPSPEVNPADQLADFRSQLTQGYQGVPPCDPVLRAFCDIALECHIPISEPLCFLDAMEQDLVKIRYETYTELREYMRGSAAAVGVMMCYILGSSSSPKVVEPAVALGEAMQMTNFLRDVGEDMRRGRIYLPQEDMARHGVSEESILAGQVTDRFIELMKFEIHRTRELYRFAESGIPRLPEEGQKAVRISLELYEMILDRIIDRNYDVFTGRARTSRLEKLRVAARIMLRS